jgi:hypothetical protein
MVRPSDVMVGWGLMVFETVDVVSAATVTRPDLSSIVKAQVSCVLIAIGRRQDVIIEE